MTTTTPRVDALIERVMDAHPSVGRAAQAAYYEAVHQELAPLARELEAEAEALAEKRAHLTNRIVMAKRVIEAAKRMRYSNTISAVHAFDAALAAWGDKR